MNRQNNRFDRVDRRTNCILIAVAGLLALLISLPIIHMRRQSSARGDEMSHLVSGDFMPEIGDARDGHLSGMSKQEIIEQMQKIADASQFSFKINASPVFEHGRAKGNLRIENPIYNVYPMAVEIYLDATGELIYTSGGIMPNYHIDEAHLMCVLEKGTYGATARLYAYDPDTLICQGESAVKLNIKVKN